MSRQGDSQPRNSVNPLFAGVELEVYRRRHPLFTAAQVRPKLKSDRPIRFVVDGKEQKQ